VLTQFRPDRVLVQGDTAATFAAGLAAFYEGIPVGHVEAGLRSANLFSPWPEEATRRLTSIITELHFAPTAEAAANLRAEGAIVVTGNTVVDARITIKDLLRDDERLANTMRERFSWIDPNKKLLQVTGHRRENLGERLAAICEALLKLSAREDVQICYVVHLNPNVRNPVRKILRQSTQVKLLGPQDYLSFVYLMSRSHLRITDSGGVQEEAPKTTEN